MCAGDSLGVEVDMTGGGWSVGRGMVRCRLIWNNAMVGVLVYCVSRAMFPTLAHSRENRKAAGQFGTNYDEIWRMKRLSMLPELALAFFRRITLFDLLCSSWLPNGAKKRKEEQEKMPSGDYLTTSRPRGPSSSTPYIVRHTGARVC